MSIIVYDVFTETGALKKGMNKLAIVTIEGSTAYLYDIGIICEEMADHVGHLGDYITLAFDCVGFNIIWKEYVSRPLTESKFNEDMTDLYEAFQRYVGNK